MITMGFAMNIRANNKSQSIWKVNKTKTDPNGTYWKEPLEKLKAENTKNLDLHSGHSI